MVAETTGPKGFQTRQRPGNWNQRSRRVLGSKPVDIETSIETQDADLALPVSPIDVPALSPNRTDSPSTIDLGEDIESSNARDDSVLVCPICNETMVSLLQLNRHLDDAHKVLDDPKDYPLKPGLSWIKKNLDRARQFPASQMSRLDVFTTDEHEGEVNGSGTPPRSASPRMQIPIRATKASEEMVSRDHWKKPAGGERCSFPACNKILAARNGLVNCRKCGKLYCNEHTMYQMKLSSKARHDPEHGYWCRVCELCYESRAGYFDACGNTHDITGTFARMREDKLHHHEMETNRLEKRLVVLIKELSKLASETGILSYGKMLGRKQIEHRVAVWQSDNEVERCPICEHKFNYALRKHHCRVCGKIVCADLATDCSREVILSVLALKLELDYPASTTYGVRMCRDCKDTMFSKRNFEHDMDSDVPALLQQYQTLTRVKKAIDVALPKFKNTLVQMNDPLNPPDKDEIKDAADIRRKLLQSFSQYDSLARKISMIQVQSDTERRLQKQIYHFATQYLHDNMLPLKALPEVLKHVPGGSSGKVSGAQASSSSTQQSSLSTQEIENLRQQLLVMEEQKFMVEQMVNTAKSRRRFDEVVVLEESLADLRGEIDKLRNQLGDFAFGGE